MKRRVSWWALWIGLVLVAGCGDRGGEPAPAAPPAAVDRDVALPSPAPAADEAVPEAPAALEFTLAYLADEHGAIDGEALQTVAEGGDGTPVTAVPAEGYRFVGWSDGSTDNPRRVMGVSGDLEVTALFALREHTLTYSAGEGGSLEGTSPQVVGHGGEGSPVRAVAARGYRFAGWSDGSAENPRTDRDLAADVEVTAAFSVRRYTLTYTPGEGGSVDGRATQTVPHGTAGSPVTAVPADGYRFAGWSDGVETPSRTDRDVTAPLAVAAEFALREHTLTYTAGDHGAVEGPSPQTVLHGGDGSPVTAVADPGYHFVAWSDGVATPTRADAGVTGDLSVEASFEVNTYTVAGTVSGLVEGTEVVLRHSGVEELTVTANGPFAFETALLDGSPYAVTAEAQPRAPNQTCTVERGTGTVAGADVADVSVTCVRDRYTVGGTLAGLPEGTRLTLRLNGRDDLVLTADGAFTFPAGVEDGLPYEVTIHRQPAKKRWFCEVDRGSGTLSGQDVTDVDVACFPEAHLEAVAGIRKVDLSWNAEDFRGVSFNLCRAREDLAEADFARCPDLAGGVYQPRVDSPRAVSGLTNDVTYWFRLEVLHPSGRRTYSDVVSATPFGGLNDTGIDWCADDGANRSAAGTRADKAAGCEGVAATHPDQDGHHGRDAAARARTLAKTGTGSAGFDFTKVCGSGEAAGEGKCPPNPALGTGPTNWSCTRDNVTGLLWELKTEGGLRGRGNTYTWFQPDEATNGGEPGVEKGGQCVGSGCDTRAFAAAVNALRLCGASDWRVPTRKELLSIVDNGRFEPAVDPAHFPNTDSAYFWTTSAYPEQPSSAWHVYFHYGEAYPNPKSNANPVRLVRGRTVTFGLDNP